MFSPGSTSPEISSLNGWPLKSAHHSSLIQTSCGKRRLRAQTPRKLLRRLQSAWPLIWVFRQQLRQDWHEATKFTQWQVTKPRTQPNQRFFEVRRTMRAQSTVEQKLTRARTQLLLNQPFFGTLCLRLKLMPGSRPTLATDGVRIIYNPSFVDSLTPAELEGCLAHEVLHCALGHHARRGVREPRLWNHAADYAINPILVKNGLKLPAGVLLDPQYENLPAEEIYARLTKDGNSSAGSQPNSPGTGNGSQANSEPQPDPSSPSTAQNPSSGGGSPNCGAQGAGIDASPGGIGEVLDAADENGDPASPAE